MKKPLLLSFVFFTLILTGCQSSEDTGPTIAEEDEPVIDSPIVGVWNLQSEFERCTTSDDTREEERLFSNYSLQILSSGVFVFDYSGEFETLTGTYTIEEDVLVFDQSFHPFRVIRYDIEHTDQELKLSIDYRFVNDNSDCTKTYTLTR